ncbi:LacI family transcriptional regulator [Pectobacterium atrosepticum]|uniref:LacI family DNA-binding transcriptional regulator n=1 Tax=Pectobacterium versatile TaxID=2488639 RepID=UPI000F8D754A|nr:MULTISPECIES: LacI family DNA-binding transcriptional regulator [Pectobacterium]MCL6372143.1 LacI family transcriptional regulator [Pectobacterium atrosepticum]RUR95625.1 LacI family transcriptional regulator [Pectobacterium versatile]
MSIQKIARIAGVSVATVSRVLNNIDTVKPQNRERVLNAIKSSNYQPNLLARQLRTARSQMLLVMVSNIANPFCADVVKGIEAEAEENGYRILLCNSGADIVRAHSSLQLLSGKMVDGVITMDAISTLSALQDMIGAAPWVQCAEHDDTSAISSVGIDNAEASRFVINHFIGKGRRRIAMINHDMNYLYAQQREKGYRDVIAENAFDYGKVEYASTLSYAGGKAAMTALLNDPERPDAVFVVSDTLAAGALSAICEAGLSAPQDIAVIGFDGSELGYITSPQLSTIQQPSAHIGREAVKLLLQQIDQPDSKTEKRLLEWTFVERASS